MHFDEEMGFQDLGPGITVLSPSDPRPPTVCKWPEVGGVPIVSGDGQCSDIVSEVFKHLRGYLRPLTLAGIYPNVYL